MSIHRLRERAEPTGAPKAAPADSIRVDDLHKSFGALEVLKGVSMRARQGDVISMIGSSGSGKSTFLRCTNLLEQPNDGRIIIDGEEIRLKRSADGSTSPADMRQVEGAKVIPKDPREYVRKLRFHRGLAGPAAYGLT